MNTWLPTARSLRSAGPSSAKNPGRWSLTPLCVPPRPLRSFLSLRLLIAVVALWFGARQIVRPIQNLEARATKLAWGDFKAIEEPVGGIAEIRHLQAELVGMAHKLQAAQKNLHNYIGAITRGQEEERRRMARDLHDDTIQSLIALKQRLQLLEMAPQNEPPITAIAELENSDRASHRESASPDTCPATDLSGRSWVGGGA